MSAGGYAWTIPVLPFVEQAPLYDGMMSQARPSGDGTANAVDNYNGNANAWENQFWKKDLPVFICPSDNPPPDRGESPALLNYKVCVGDDYHQNHFLPSDNRQNRGIFQMERWQNMSAIRDGTSNTVMLGELATGGDRYDIKYGVAVNMQAWNPAACLARVNPVTKRLTDPVREQFRPAGGRAWDGRPYFVGFATLVAPNGPSCHWGGVDGNEHMGTLSSNHPGGAQVAMADGSVTFISSSIDTGNQAIDDIQDPGSRLSPWGVWGALGSQAGGESASLPQ